MLTRVRITDFYWAFDSHALFRQAVSVSLWILCPFLLSAQPSELALPAGAVSWWQAEGNAIDCLRGNDGQVSGGLGYLNGEVGKAFRFGGNSGNCVRIPYAASLGSPTYTIEAWVNPLVPIADTTNQKVVFAQNTGRVALLLRPGTTGVQVWFGYYSGSGIWQLLQSSVEIPLAQFSHVAASWDGTTQRLYVNGALAAQRVPPAPPLDSGCDFFIGGISSTAGGSTCHYSGQFFQGLIDELRYYRRALTTAEIQAIYNAGENGVAPPAPLSAPVAGPDARPTTFALDLQKRDPASGGAYLTRQVFHGSQMAIIVMDVWNSHPDPEMASRGSALIPRMNEALAAARALGITVIFCPNEVSPPAGINTGAFSGLPNQPLLDNGFNPPLPSFTSSTPGDMVPVGYDASYAPRFATYTSQHPDLLVEPGDLASISRQQIYNYCAAHGISYLLYMGVAANMCVCCTRETSMIPMKRFCGLEPILVRDLTDSMTLNGRRRTGVDDSGGNIDLTMSPDEGHRMVVAQDETYICSSIDSRQLLQYSPSAAYSSLITGNSSLLCFWQMNSRVDYQEIPDARRTQTCWWNRADPNQTTGLSFAVTGAISNSPDRAVQFDGSTILISPLYRDDIPTNSPLFSLSSTSFTLETWVRPAMLNSNQWFYSHDDGTPGGVDVLLGLNSSNRFQFVVGSDAQHSSFGDLLESDIAVTESDLESGHWFHVVAVHDRHGGTVSLYIDARLAAQSNETCTPVQLSSAPHFGSRGLATLGGSPFLSRSGFEFYHGALDDFAVYSSAVDPGTILEHYQVGIGQTASPPLVQFSAAQGNMQISWPAWPLGLKLQSSTDLLDWQDFAVPVKESDGFRQVSAPMTEPRQFFRLGSP